MTYRYADFDFRQPDYAAVFQKRAAALKRLRGMTPQQVELLRQHYKRNPVDFIVDWGVTTDPRNLERGLPALVPFILFPRQVEFVEWVLERWKAREGGLSDKSRDMGLSWVAIALSCTLALFHRDMIIGFGSRKEEYVDKSGSPKSLFWKGRQFLRYLPTEFRGGFNPREHAPHMRITIPNTNSVIAGEAGDNIGRGDRASIYWVDESAFLARPQLIDAALSQTTNCRIDISSVNGTDNPFAEKRFSWPERKIFTFHWRQDPRKNEAWYAKQCEELNPLVVAQEIDLDYNSSKEGALIPAAWIQAAVDLHKRFSIQPTGARVCGFDVADEGIDLNALASRKGIVLDHLEAWSGKGGTVYGSTLRVMNVCHVNDWHSFRYDSDGLGVGVRGDADRINQDRVAANLAPITAEPFHGSGAVVDPKKPVVAVQGRSEKGRLNEDMFANRKAQGWWHLRTRFEHSFKLSQGEPYDPDMLISLDATALGPALGKLTAELGQPTYSLNTVGKVVVDKAPEGQRSPNYADACMIAFAPAKSRSGFFS